MIREARRNDNIRDMLTGLKDIITEWDWTDVRPVEEVEVDELDEESNLDLDDIDTDSTVEAGHKGTKEYLFRGESTEVIEKLEVDDVALYSVSDSVVSKQMSNILVKHIRKENMGDNLVIADGMACVGGNSIAFARTPIFKTVISNELDGSKGVNGRVKMLENNLIDVLGLSNVSIMNTSILDAPFLGDIDILFLDPEWSDKKGVSKTEITIGDIVLDKFVETTFMRHQRVKIIALKLPYTYDKSLLSKFNSEAGYQMYTYYLGARSNILYILIVKTNESNDAMEIDDDTLHTDFYYPVDSPNPESSKICKHYVEMFPMIDMNDEDAYNHLNTVVLNKWAIRTPGGKFVCRNCGETIKVAEDADEQFQTAGGVSMVTREVVITPTTGPVSLDVVLDLNDERFDTEKRIIYGIVTDLLRVLKTTISREQLEELVFSTTGFGIQYPKSLLDIRNIAKTNSTPFNIKSTALYKDTVDSTGAANTRYTKKPFSKIPRAISVYAKLGNPGTFERFVEKWNDYIKAQFETPKMSKYVKYMTTLMFGDENKEDKRFQAETWDEFINEFIKMKKKLRLETDQLTH